MALETSAKSELPTAFASHPAYKTVSYITKYKVIVLTAFCYITCRHNCLFLVDTVASLGAAPIFMDKQSKTMINKGLNSVTGYHVPACDIMRLSVHSQILTSCTVVLRRLWMHLLVQHPSPLMTEHGEEGLSDCPYMSHTETKSIWTKHLFVFLLPLTATRCLTGKQNQYPTSLIWHICPTTGVVMVNQPECKSTTVNWLHPYSLHTT